MKLFNTSNIARLRNSFNTNSISYTARGRTPASPHEIHAQSSLPLLRAALCYTGIDIVLFFLLTVPLFLLYFAEVNKICIIFLLDYYWNLDYVMLSLLGEVCRFLQARAENNRRRLVHIRRDDVGHSDVEGRRHGRRRSRATVSGPLRRL